MDPLREALFLGLIEGFPAWTYIAFGMLSIAAFAAHIFISYALGSVVVTLAILEDTSPGANMDGGFVADDDATEILPPYRDSMDSTTTTDDGSRPPPEPRVEQQQTLLVGGSASAPLTSSMRGTLAHLQREAGSRWAPMRAFRVFYFYNAIASTLGVTVGAAFGGGSFSVIPGVVFGEVAFAALNMVRVHMVLSKPSRKWFWQRMRRDRIALRAIILPTLTWSLARTLPVVGISSLAFYLFPMVDMQAPPPGSGDDAARSALMTLVVAALKLLLLLVVAFVALFGIYVPAKIVLARCQAALLPEDETPLIPFDRTFGGRVQQRTGTLRMRDAWRSVDREGRTRVGRLYAVTLVLLTLNWAAYGLCILLVAVMTTRSIRGRGDGGELR